MSSLTPLLLLWRGLLLCWASGGLAEREDMAPLEVKFHSLDFRNVLHWKCQPRAPNSMRYFVQYKVYGDKQWTACERCQGIRKHQCDLSQETSDPKQWYYARVHSVSSKERSPWVITPRFHPQWETTFSPPQMRLNVTEKGIVVQLRPPRSPFRGQKNTRISATEQQLRFRIYLMKNGVEEGIHETEGYFKNMVIPDLRARTTYCLHAVTIMPLSGRLSRKSPSRCLTMP
ncbi:interleukin-22 receptor subunit alpha-2 isoform X2 [Brachyhypopomus gauderio]|uniref:interleukin-22 receptor subunit alpha-2 isoform X2 n=1 Tax=Brachyhypopomus gauderio TaxID=698409 RepID=UPI004041E2F6